MGEFVFESHPRLPPKKVLLTHSHYGLSRPDLVWHVAIGIPMHGLLARAVAGTPRDASVGPMPLTCPPQNNAVPGPLCTDQAPLTFTGSGCWSIHDNRSANPIGTRHRPRVLQILWHE